MNSGSDGNSNGKRVEIGVRGLLRRQLGDRADRFEPVRCEAEDGHDVFSLSAADGRVRVDGNNGVSIASGVNWYLKHHAQGHLSWCGDQLNLPDPLPSVETSRVVSPYAYRYAYNYCTFSYSMAWWDWARWEREIDWLALHGVNAPLSVTGQEAVWRNVYREMGLTDEELGAFFAGPAFLAWGWMGNLDGWGGPLTRSWIDGQCELQQKIVARERELGMRPVLPAFTGHVPAALRRLYPEAQVTQFANWAQDFTGTYLLDPEDPLFAQIGKLFLEEQTRLFGTDHLYSCDTFNENSPPSNDLGYLDRLGKAIYGGMTGADPDAVWIMQGWMFFFNPEDPDFWGAPQVRALVDSVPDGRLVVLDLHSELKPVWDDFEAYFGKPWVWNTLHNFGGKRAIYGNLDVIAEVPPALLTDAKSGRMDGLGFTPEGIEQNPVVYDLTTDMMWRSTPPDVDAWLKGYAHRRYGAALPEAEKAWEVLHRSVYNWPADWGRAPSSVLCFPPSLKPWYPIYYEPLDLVRALGHLMACAPRARGADPYLYDLVDVTRQVLSNYSDVLHAEIVTAFDAKDRERLRAVAGDFLKLIDDMDVLLATRSEFLLGKWIADARAWGKTPKEQDHLEWNARVQLTLWGPPQGMLRDYARKEWSGLLGTFYRGRWERFFLDLDACLAEERPHDNLAFQRELRAWEDEWTRGREPYPAEPSGDAVERARDIARSYIPRIRAAGTPTSGSTDGEAGEGSGLEALQDGLWTTST